MDLTAQHRRHRDALEALRAALASRQPPLELLRPLTARLRAQIDRLHPTQRAWYEASPRYRVERDVCEALLEHLEIRLLGRDDPEACWRAAVDLCRHQGDLLELEAQLGTVPERTPDQPLSQRA